MSTLTIPAIERGVIRVFSISRPMAEMRSVAQAKSTEALAGDLLGAEMPEDSVEIFPVSDLEGVGLPGYLIDGHGLMASQINADRAKLEALDGYVMLLFSQAFDGKETRLSPDRDLTLIGAYREERRPGGSIPLESEAALPQTGVPDVTPPAAPKGRAGSVMVVLAVLTILILLLVWALR